MEFMNLENIYLNLKSSKISEFWLLTDFDGRPNYESHG